jgi:hypothetical protein
MRCLSACPQCVCLHSVCLQCSTAACALAACVSVCLYIPAIALFMLEAATHCNRSALRTVIACVSSVLFSVSTCGAAVIGANDLTLLTHCVTDPMHAYTGLSQCSI